MTFNIVDANPKSAQSFKFNWVSGAFFATVHALALLAPWFFSWSALGVTIFLHWSLGSIGICLGYHRLLTHRSLHVPKGLEYAIAILGTLALQGGPIFWVAGHRRHHTYTEDIDLDPYSAKRGFWWSHMGWLLYERPEFFEYESNRKFAPDLAKQEFYRWLDRYYLLLQIPLGVGLYLLGGWAFVIYGLFLRAVLLWHSTWLINSASHITGYRSHDSDDNSRNLWWAALLTYGEGWHNNHHAYPNVAKAGWKWWEIDMTWWVIVSLRQVGLARRIVLPPSA
ncbi:fatty acid desaturase [Aetokthonos hydrillicola Thurmond2011]|uniref:Fatty acid desaturase n=1 Tax=Aetokthonos hydrillicola Thurmond2011 TaxID=2712845 RepID=A0AAP5IGD8_9CYAN|nr:fatty acid desaturase [Aetokthonos hydrillicola]MBO3463646.1 acyl-CoA desaturase [Aetokthonos hydrillicola CCALA 1050]MBW4590445.1 fatty acid desaturase [Aetokthonos hydrillicola CCALA 1050]MDR9899727.1 fatty acid desaturase [Aetokthonos hydrillicola Thurmond2011]